MTCAVAQDPKNQAQLPNYISGFSPNVREIIENFQLDKVVEKLIKNDLLYMLIEKFTEVDLSPNNVTNHEMGYIFEELLRRFSEMSNETAGEHYTPREIIRLMVSLLFAEHQHQLQGKGIIRSVYDPACGTDGMLITAKEYIRTKINPDVEVTLTVRSSTSKPSPSLNQMLIIGEPNIRQGSSFTRTSSRALHYMLNNPPSASAGQRKPPSSERANDLTGALCHAPQKRRALLFLQHMVSKMEAGGSRVAIIFNGSPLFTGDAGSGESDIRKWIIENDWLEAIIAMPNDMFYNTGIATYIWLDTNRKPRRRKGKVQLINAVDYSAPMRKSLGNKRNYFTDEHIQQITQIYTEFSESKVSKIFDNPDFGYTKVTVERARLHPTGHQNRQKRQPCPIPP